jgi:hypothetical protein
MDAPFHDNPVTSSAAASSPATRDIAVFVYFNFLLFLAAPFLHGVCVYVMRFAALQTK